VLVVIDGDCGRLEVLNCVPVLVATGTVPFGVFVVVDACTALVWHMTTTDFPDTSRDDVFVFLDGGVFHSITGIAEG
jgi:hypothetical protein